MLGLTVTEGIGSLHFSCFGRPVENKVYIFFTVISVEHDRFLKMGTV